MKVLVWILLALIVLLPPLWLALNPPPAKSMEWETIIIPPQWEPIPPQEESQQHLRWTPPNLPKQDA